MDVDYIQQDAITKMKRQTHYCFSFYGQKGQVSDRITTLVHNRVSDPIWEIISGMQQRVFTMSGEEYIIWNSRLFE